MVDESGLMLRQLMRQARQRIAKGGSVIRTSVSTFMEFIGNNPNAFRLLLRERSAHRRRFVPPSRVKFSTLSRNLPTILNSKTICHVRLLKHRPRRW